MIAELPKLMIHLPGRTDRMENILRQCQFMPIEDYKIIQGVKDRLAYKGIGQAHLNCIRLAKDSGWDKVLIMEDDLDFYAKEKTLPYITEALNKLPEDWDVLLFGIYGRWGLKNFNEYWDRVNDFAGLHFYIVNSKAYDKILDYSGNTHIDRWMGKNVTCYVTKKYPVLQLDGISDNTGKKQSYGHLIPKQFLL